MNQIKFHTRLLIRLIKHAKFLKIFIHKLNVVSNIATNGNTTFESATRSQSNLDLQLRVNEISEHLRPSKAANIKFKRFGSIYDGGYVLADNFQSDGSLLSLGVGDNIDFDEELSTVLENLHLYDHTVNHLPKEIPGAIFFKEKIGKDDGEITLDQALDRLDTKKNVILKMDIEGAEWDVIEISENLGRFDQIVIEFHGMHLIQDLLHFRKMNESLRKIRITHFPVYVHPNNYSILRFIGNTPMCDVIEVLYLNKENYIEVAPMEGPESLLTPNAPEFAEYSLNFPTYLGFKI